MRVIVCGGRKWGIADQGKSKSTVVGERQMLFYSLHGRGITEVIHGACEGADEIAGEWARANNVKETPVEAEWEKCAKLGRRNSAGPIRNGEMLKLKPDLVIALPGGNGTKNMVNQATAAGIPVERIGWDAC